MELNHTVSEERLAGLVDRFYAKVRADALIGPLFNRSVEDWPHHLEKLAAFWSSVMLTSGRYKGNPVAEHVKHMGSITPAMFDRWLSLWAETTSELLEPGIARQFQEKAGRIAESLQLALKFHAGVPTVAAPARPPARSDMPYRSTPVFDQDSLPGALRREHRTRAGTWGVIRVLAGRLRLHRTEGGEVEELSEDCPGIVAPEQAHWVEPIGPFRMQVDFHDAPPALARQGA